MYTLKMYLISGEVLTFDKLSKDDINSFKTEFTLHKHKPFYIFVKGTEVMVDLNKITHADIIS